LPSLNKLGRTGDGTNEISSLLAQSGLTDKPPVVDYPSAILRDGKLETGCSFNFEQVYQLFDKGSTALDFTPFTLHTEGGLMLHQHGVLRDNTGVTCDLQKDESHAGSKLSIATQLQAGIVGLQWTR